VLLAGKEPTTGSGEKPGAKLSTVRRRRYSVISASRTVTAPLLGYLMADPAYRREVASVTPLGEIGTPQLLADTVVNVLRSDWLTGQVIAVDGGESLVTARGRWALPRSAPRSRPTT
jgi:NAD(P)-dependent dehydrogenase (short-subunit alcohol dehydrogenase family)